MDVIVLGGGTMDVIVLVGQRSIDFLDGGKAVDSNLLKGCRGEGLSGGVVGCEDGN